jgi:outer membrane protein OmpA-like peptidoglycan-associated protein
MNARHIAGLILLTLAYGCGPGLDMQPMLKDFDNYSKELRAVATDDQAIKTLDEGQVKRAEAGALVEKGKQKEALPVLERAMADARLALEMDRMNVSSHRAEKCRLEVEQARTKWSEAVFVLEQTETFVGQKSPIETKEPVSAQAEPDLPATTLTTDSIPPATLEGVNEQWTAWRTALIERKVPAADLETAYWHSYDRTQAEKVGDAATAAHHRYLTVRALQSLECRVRAETNERVCLDATLQTSAYADARADALRATLNLERGLKDSLRKELDQSRAESKTRQDELYDALSQMQGKFANITRDARGTIVSLADILFDSDKATLRRDAEFNLVKIATILNQFPDMKIAIEGHTDAVGTDEYNLGLSRRRAQAVHDFLVSQDVAESRLSWEGYGEARPVADNDTEEGRQKNRRVDLIIQDAPEGSSK